VRDITTKEKVDRFNPVFTVHEVAEELNRIGYKNKVFITRLFKPYFAFENLGKTNAIDLMIEIDAKLPNEEWKSAFKANTTITLVPSQPNNVTFDMELPIELPLPAALNFRIRFSYKDVNNNIIKTEIKAKWTSNDNYWSYGEM
jgi:hypothetical protein